MGDFHVSCGITRLSIGYGEDCVLLPLITPKNYRGINIEWLPYATHQSTSLIVHNFEMWQPFCFPIRGKYNDYGSIEDIVKDENTERIEKYFSISIEDFVELVTDTRKDVYDTFSHYNKIFYEYPEDLDYDANLEVFLTHLNFQKEINEYGNIYILDDVKILIEDNKLKVNWSEELSETYRWQEDFLKAFLKYKKYYIGVKDVENLKLLLAVGGMFILGDVYDYYTTNHMSKKENLVKKYDFNSFILNDFGFETEDFKTFKKMVDNIEVVVSYKSPYDKTINGVSFYDLEDFLKEYKKITQKTLSISKYKGLDTFIWDELEQKYIGINYLKQLVEKGNFLFDDNKISNWKNKDEIMNFIDFNISEIRFIGIERIFPHIGLFKEFSTLTDIYLSSLMVGDLLDKFTEFRRLYKAMYLTNVLFVPSFCGAQYGCDTAEVKLAYITNQIVEKRQKQREEYSVDFTPINPMEGFNDRFY